MSKLSRFGVTVKNWVCLVSVGLSAMACAPIPGHHPLEDGESLHSKIVGGVPVESFHPVELSTVVLYYQEEGTQSLINFCGGTLVIDSSRVLSAAHCFMDLALEKGVSLSEFIKNVWVGFGPHLVESLADPKAQLIRVQSVQVHHAYELFDQKKIETQALADISLIKLASSVPLPYKPVFLASSSDLKEGQEIWVAGFGLTHGFMHKKTDRLMKVNLEVKNPFFSSYQFLSKAKMKKSTCSGDSGGPAFIKNERGELLLLGIVSWGDAFCSIQTAYTSVPAFEEWIYNQFL